MEIEQILKALFSLLLVVGLIGATAFLLKRFVLERGFVNLGSKTQTKKRLKIVEQLFLDNKRRLVIIEKDGSEEITLVIGTTSETLVSVNCKKVKK